MLITQENASAIVQEIQDNPDPEIEYHISVFSAERFEGRYVVKPSTIEIEHDGQWVEPLEELTRYLHQNCKVIVSKLNRQEYRDAMINSILENYCEPRKAIVSWLCDDPENQDLKEAWESVNLKIPTFAELKKETQEGVN